MIRRAWKPFPTLGGAIRRACGKAVPASWRAAAHAAFDRDRWHDFRTDFFAWCRKNGLYALLALAISCGIWYNVTETATEYDRELTLEVSVSSEGAEGKEGKIYGVKPATVKTTFHGSHENLLQLDVIKPKIVIPRKFLATASETNDVSVALLEKYVTEHGFLDVSFDPPSVTVTIDEKDTRSVLLAPPDKEGSPYHGHVQDIRPVTNKVSVTGAKSKLDSLDSLRLEPVNVANRAGVFTIQDVKVVIPPEFTWIEKCEPSHVDVSVVVEPDNKTLTYSNIEVRVAIHAGSVLPRNYELVPPSVSLSVTAWEKDIPSIVPQNLVVYADLEKENLFLLSPGAPWRTSTVSRLRAVIPPELAIERVRIIPTNILFVAKPPPPPPPPQTNIVTRVVTNVVYKTAATTNAPPQRE